MRRTVLLKCDLKYAQEGLCYSSVILSAHEKDRVKEVQSKVRTRYDLKEVYDKIEVYNLMKCTI